MKKLIAILIIFGMLGGAITVQAFDLTRYAELKAAGQIYFSEILETVTVVKKKYDPDLGTEIPVSMAFDSLNRPLPVDRVSIVKQRDQLQSLIEQYNVFLKDYDAAVLAADQP